MKSNWTQFFFWCTVFWTKRIQLCELLRWDISLSEKCRRDGAILTQKKSQGVLQRMECQAQYSELWLIFFCFQWLWLWSI